MNLIIMSLLQIYVWLWEFARSSFNRLHNSVLYFVIDPVGGLRLLNCDEDTNFEIDTFFSIKMHNYHWEIMSTKLRSF